MTEREHLELTGARVPEPPLPPRMTRIEQACWVVYGLVALLLLVIPILTHSFGLPDIAAWVLLIATVAITAYWMRSGTLRGPEWLKPGDYERFLKEIQRVPGAEGEEPAPPRPTGPPRARGRSDVQPPPR